MKEQSPPADFCGWIKFMRGRHTKALQQRPNVNHLLSVIAQEIDRDTGEALLTPRKCGFTRSEFRAALKALKKLELVIEIEEGATTSTTTPETTSGTAKGTRLRLANTRIYDVNLVTESQDYDHMNDHMNDLKNEGTTTSATTRAATSAKKATTSATTSATTYESEEAQAGEEEIDRNGEATTTSATTRAATSAKKATTSATTSATCLLKKSPSGKENKEKEGEEIAAAAPPVDSSLSLITWDATEVVKELDVAYRKMVLCICGELHPLRAKGFEAAKMFLNQCTAWTPDAILYVGAKALIETSNPPLDGNDDYWWSRHYAKDLTKMMVPTREEKTPLLMVADEVGFDVRYYTPQKLGQALADLVQPYIDATVARQEAEKAGRS